MAHTSRLPFGAGLSSRASPEACLDAKMKAMAAARTRRSASPVLPDLNSLPQAGGRLPRADETGIAAGGDHPDGCVEMLSWQDRRIPIHVGGLGARDRSVVSYAMDIRLGFSEVTT